MLIYRLPKILTGTKNLSLAYPASHCVLCSKPIPFYLNIPLIGYFVCAGKCFHCKERISPLYPLTELICMSLALLAGWLWGADIKTLSALLLLCGLFTLSIIDGRSGYLPDELSLGLLWLGLLSNAFGIWVDAADAIWGSCLGYGALATINALYKALRHRDGLGGGDMKLFAALGAFFGWQGLLPMLLVASILGSCCAIFLLLIKSRETKQIAFGPFLALAGLIYMLGLKHLPF